MAGTAAKQLQYHRGGAVYGDLAYSLEHEVSALEVSERELRRAAERPIPRPAVQEHVRSEAKVKTRTQQKVSPVAVMGVLGVVAMALLVLVSYVQLTMISSSVVSLKSELSALQAQNVALTAEYERLYDLASVKEAAEAAGMAKPSNSQVYYIDLSEGDSAVVYQQQDTGILSRLLTSLGHGIYTAVEYFN